MWTFDFGRVAIISSPINTWCICVIKDVDNCSFVLFDAVLQYLCHQVLVPIFLIMDVNQSLEHNVVCANTHYKNLHMFVIRSRGSKASEITLYTNTTVTLSQSQENQIDNNTKGTPFCPSWAMVQYYESKFTWKVIESKIKFEANQRASHFSNKNWANHIREHAYRGCSRKNYAKKKCPRLM